MKTCALILSLSLFASACSAPSGDLFGPSAGSATRGSGTSSASTASSGGEASGPASSSATSGGYGGQGASSGPSTTTSPSSASTSTGEGTGLVTVGTGPSSSSSSASSSSSGGGCSADCPPAGEASLNCEPSCGPVDPRCSAGDASSVELANNAVLWVRSPDAPAGTCGADWAVRLHLPLGEHWSFTVDGPPSSVSANASPAGSPPPALCSQPYGGVCATGESPANPSAADVYLYLGSAKGALFRVEVYDGTGLAPSCAGACYGVK